MEVDILHNGAYGRQWTWTGIFWPRKRKNGRIFWTWWWTFGFSIIRGFSWLVKKNPAPYIYLVSSLVMI